MSKYQLTCDIRCICGRVNTVEDGSTVTCACGATNEIRWNRRGYIYPNVLLDKGSTDAAIEQRKINRPELVAQRWK